MQIKITQMREIIIEMFTLFSNWLEIFESNEQNELCSMIEVITGIHLEEAVPKDLCLIIKSD